MKRTILFILVATALSCTSCYRMPGDDEFCLVPATNNPSATHEKAQGPIPQLSY